MWQFLVHFSWDLDMSVMMLSGLIVQTRVISIDYVLNLIAPIYEVLEKRAALSSGKLNNVVKILLTFIWCILRLCCCVVCRFMHYWLGLLFCVYFAAQLIVIRKASEQIYSKFSPRKHFIWFPNNLCEFPARFSCKHTQKKPPICFCVCHKYLLNCKVMIR